MRNVCLGLAVMAALILAPASPAFGGTPDLEIRAGSTVSILSLGGEIDIEPQFLSMAPAEDPLYEMRSLESLMLSRYDTAFEEYVDLFQNQELQVFLNPGTGAATVDFPLWVIDSDGNRIELPMTLTTGVPSTIACGGWPFCIGTGSDPDYCAGSPWDTQSGELRLVGVVLVPDDSGLTIECSGIVFEVEATISPADTDGDGDLDAFDNCPDHYNASQADDDGPEDDGIGDVCDNCPDTYNPNQTDDDADGSGNACQPLRINFQPDASAVPLGYLKDTGTPFSQAVGRGWLNASLQSRDRVTGGGDERLETFVFDSISRAWEATLRPALYDLSLAIGDRGYAMGPHRVLTEDTVVFEDVMTAAGENLFADVDAAQVSDGRLTVDIGGVGGYTMLNFVDIVEAGDQPFHGQFVNFQPSGYPVPDGFEADSGLVYDPGRGYGWEVNMGWATRDRGTLADPVLDTLIVSADPRTWKLDLPADVYDVVISMGDSGYPMGPQRVMVEGETWLDGDSTAAGEFLRLTGHSLVLDGALTITIGGAGGFTVINYVAVTATPRDVDEDGVGNLNDNCIDLYNPGQADSNGNGVGDLCSADTDGDGHTDPMDNCPEVPNEDQLDTDGDEYGDACDCAPTNGTVFSPAVEVAVLIVNDGPGTFSSLIWSPQGEESGAGTWYDLASGMLSALQIDAGFASATCLQPDLIQNQYTDQRAVPSGDGFYYLVRADNECEPAGTYGSGDAGARATLDSSGPCP